MTPTDGGVRVFVDLMREQSGAVAARGSFVGHHLE
jgi:hypothetical protein